MHRNPSLNPKPGDILRREVGSQTYQMEVESRNSGIIIAKYTGKKNTSKREYALHKWCTDMAEWHPHITAECDEDPRDPRTEPKAKDVLHRPDLTKNNTRKVLGTSSVTLPAGAEYIEVQFHVLSKGKPQFNSCSIQTWWQWAANAELVVEEKEGEDAAE